VADTEAAIWVTQCVAVGSAVRGDVERSALGVESIAHAGSE
jgi:hypothetical protein